MIKAPIDLQDLRRRIYAKAKAEPSWRFWGLYVHVCKTETLQAAYRLAKENNGAFPRSSEFLRAAPARACTCRIPTPRATARGTPHTPHSPACEARCERRRERAEAPGLDTRWRRLRARDRRREFVPRLVRKDARGDARCRLGRGSRSASQRCGEPRGAQCPSGCAGAVEHVQGDRGPGPPGLHRQRRSPARRDRPRARIRPRAARC